MTNRIKTIIVDDNYAFLKEVEDYLQTKDEVEVVGVTQDGKEALRMIFDLRPDVLILDMLMPGIDGLAVLDGMSGMSDGEKPLTIVVTGARSEVISQHAMNKGADYIMLKPINNDVLFERIKMLFMPVAQTQRNKSVIENQSPGSPTKDAEIRVTNMIHSVGIPANIKGYQYLREAIMLSIYNQEIINAVTKQLYPAVADKYGTSSSRVERAIRHSIEVACTRGNADILHRFFGYTGADIKNKPTNSEFIAMIADKLRLELDVE